MRKASAVTRREFLRSAAAISAVGMLPAASWARVSGANERLNIAVIGTGGMGHAHLRDLAGRRQTDNLALTRVCDVYQRRLNSAVRLIEGTSNAGTMEYRDVLDDADVDAVLIATPDHWHIKIAIEAMEAGKNVYCEKPMSHTIEQALACRDAVRRLKRVFQVGVQGTSDDQIWQARKAIEAGRIGKPVWSQGSYCRNSREGQFNWRIDSDAGPNAAGDGKVWWDRWLGHEWNLAPRIDWNADHFFRFRKYWAYNGGVATDLMYHKLAPLLLAIRGPQGEYPLRVTSSGGQYIEKDGRDIPDTMLVMIDYPSEHTVLLASVMVNDDDLPYVIRGQHGSLDLQSPLQIREQGAWWQEFRKANADLIAHAMVDDGKGGSRPEPAPGSAKAMLTGSEPRRDHMGNFIDAIRLGTPLACDVELGCSTMVAIKMAVESYRARKTMTWDAQSEKPSAA